MTRGVHPNLPLFHQLLKSMSEKVGFIEKKTMTTSQNSFPFEMSDQFTYDCQYPIPKLVLKSFKKKQERL